MRKKNCYLIEFNNELTLGDKILFYIFRKYSYKLYLKGMRKGFNWED